MPAILPLVPSVANYRVGTTLDGVQYVFDVRWNARDEAWYMDISDAVASPVVLGVKIVLGTLLANGVRDTRMPPGFLLPRDLSGKNVDAGFDDLGTRVQVQYISPTDVGFTP